MSSEYLADYIENAAFASQRMLYPLENGELDNVGIQELCSFFRQHALCSYYLYHDSSILFSDLMKSAAAYIYFLENTSSNQIILSRAKPFYDAICGGYFDAAEKISKLSPFIWHKDKEYEDDFLFIKFIMQLFFSDAVKEDLDLTLDALNGELTDENLFRGDICRSLIDKNGELFRDSLDILVQTRKAKIEKMIEDEAIAEEYWSWMRYFSSEATALVKLAEKMGLELDSVIEDVPSILREDSGVSFREDSWKIKI